MVIDSYPRGGRRSLIENGSGGILGHLGHLGHLGYLIPYLGCRVSSRGFVLTFEPWFLFQEPKMTKKSTRMGLGHYLIPILG